LITAVALETTRIWHDHRYLDMSSLATASASAQAAA
jgi:hypothetical protein